MKILFVTRGLPASGKSYWIKQNNLTPYTLSPDSLRLMANTPLEDLEGYNHISQKNDSMIWEFFYKLLDTRLRQGDFTIIDATNTTLQNLKNYEKMAKSYDYSMFVIDFTHIPLETCLARNMARKQKGEFFVPDEIIRKMQLQLDTNPLPNKFRTLKPQSWQDGLIKHMDLSRYEKIYHIGDLQGCYSVLSENLGELDSKNFYIFLGDYIDRGIENAKVLEYLLRICDLPNVWLLEGNHERHLRRFAKGEEIHSKEFKFNTLKEIESSPLTQKDISRLCHKLKAFLLYSYNEKLVLCSHAGIPKIPQDLLDINFIPAHTMINGIGGYGDTLQVANSFLESTPSNYYQIFGHRNTQNLPVQVNDRVFVCEGKVEFGGELRVVVLDSKGFSTYEYKNLVFREIKQIGGSLKLGALIQEFVNSKWVRQKSFGDIVSFNFTKDAFNKKAWNSITCKARGLFIDIKKELIVARSYDKFFNLGEVSATMLENLRSLNYPLNAYIKENGFLGIISYYNGSLFMSSKSDLTGAFSKHLSDIVTLLRLKEKLEEVFRIYDNHSLIFEVIDPINDPHIIEYDKPKLVLLDCVYNSVEFKRIDYKALQDIANMLQLACKRHFATINSYEDLCDFIRDNRLGRVDFVDKDISSLRGSEATEAIHKNKIDDTNKETIESKINQKIQVENIDSINPQHTYKSKIDLHVCVCDIATASLAHARNDSDMIDCPANSINGDKTINYHTTTHNNNATFIEGFVIEDSNNFMFKLKCDYYSHWKVLRGMVGANGTKIKGILQREIRGDKSEIESKKLALALELLNPLITTQAQNDTAIFMKWWATRLKELLESHILIDDKKAIWEFLSKDIISLRNEFLI